MSLEYSYLWGHVSPNFMHEPQHITVYGNIAERRDSCSYVRTDRMGRNVPMDMHTDSMVWLESAINSVPHSLHNWKARVCKRAKPERVTQLQRTLELGCSSLVESCGEKTGAEDNRERVSQALTSGPFTYKHLNVNPKWKVFWVLPSSCCLEASGGRA